nr:hypothetical protein [Okeania sp. SIO2F4]
MEKYWRELSNQIERLSLENWESLGKNFSKFNSMEDYLVSWVEEG